MGWNQPILKQEMFLIAGNHHHADTDESYVAARDYRNQVRDMFERAFDYYQVKRLNYHLLRIDKILFEYEQLMGIDHCQQLYIRLSEYKPA